MFSMALGPGLISRLSAPLIDLDDTEVPTREPGRHARGIETNLDRTVGQLGIDLQNRATDARRLPARKGSRRARLIAIGKILTLAKDDGGIDGDLGAGHGVFLLLIG